jgi:hypothetical protein
MKKAVRAALVVANVVVASLVVLSALERFGFQAPWAEARALHVSDLQYGKIDTNGDGVYDWSDDYATWWLLTNRPDILEKALGDARVLQNGHVDLSPHLLTYGVRP